MEHFDHLGIRAKVDAVRKMTDNELLFQNLDEDAQVLSVAFWAPFKGSVHFGR